VTDLAKFLVGLHYISQTAIWYDNSCNGIVVINGDKASEVSGISIISQFANLSIAFSDYCDNPTAS
jgi:hypothetical protein